VRSAEGHSAIAVELAGECAHATSLRARESFACLPPCAARVIRFCLCLLDGTARSEAMRGQLNELRQSADASGRLACDSGELYEQPLTVLSVSDTVGSLPLVSLCTDSFHPPISASALRHDAAR
jgi:hypothetical protein